MTGIVTRTTAQGMFDAAREAQLDDWWRRRDDPNRALLPRSWAIAYRDDGGTWCLILAITPDQFDSLLKSGVCEP